MSEADYPQLKQN